MTAEQPAILPRPNGPVASLLAVVLHVVLLDAAVETLLGDWPVRWWVAGALLVYLAASAWLVIRRWRAGGGFAGSGSALAALAALLVVLAVSAWMPGGLQNGVRLLGQPTSTIMTVVTTVGVGLACVALFGVAGRWWWARAGFVALGAYAVAALVMGAAARTPFTALLGGGSLWQRLPFWLQGAFVGSLVLVPCGLLTLAASLVSRPAGWRRKGRLAEAATLAVVTSVAVAAVGAPSRGGAPTEAAAQVTGLSVPPPGDLRAAPLPIPAPRLEEVRAPEIVRLADTILAKVPASRFDVLERVGMLGGGVEPSLKLVRDEIRYESYAGVLRGVRGTYTAGAGNAFDRSLLLSWLLQQKGVRTRFAMGRLDRARATELFARLFESPRVEPGADPARLGDSSGARNFYDRLQARARRDYRAIRAALGDRLPATGTPSRDDVLEEIERHVWVQANVDGQWTDLDASFPDAEPGRAYASVDLTLDDLPAEARQQLIIRVAAERLVGQELRREVVLEVKQPVHALLDRQIFLIHGRSGLQALGGGLGRPLGSASDQGWTPSLWVEGETYSGRAVVFERAQASPGGLADFFGTTKSEAEAVFVAEWLEFEIEFPDGRRELTRRALVDRAGEAWRQSRTKDPAGLRPLPRDRDGVVAPRMLHNILLSAGGHDVVAYTEAVRALSVAAQTAAEPDQPEPLPFELQVWPFVLQNAALLIWSDHVLVPALNASASTRFYADSPRIWVLSAGPSGTSPDGIEMQIDLRRDVLRGIAREPRSDVTVVEGKMWFGAMEGALEHEALAGVAAVVGAEPRTTVSTSALLTPEGSVTLGLAESTRLGEFVANLEVRARFAEAIARGAWLVAPRTALEGPRFGWWEIASSGGDTRPVSGNSLNGSDIDLNGELVKRLGSKGNTGAGGVFELKNGRLVPVKPAKPWMPKAKLGAAQEYHITLEVAFTAAGAFVSLGIAVDQAIKLIAMLLI